MEPGVKEKNREAPSDSRIKEKIQASINIGAGIAATVVFWQRVSLHINVSRVVKYFSLPNVRPRPQHKQIFNELCTRLELPSEKVQLAVSEDVSCTGWGSSHLRHGGAVLLGRNSMWTSRNDVTASGFTVENKPLNMRSSADRALADTYLLSDNVVKFIIGHELIHIKHMDFLIAGIHDAAHVVAAYALGLLLAPYSLGVIPAVCVQVCVWAAFAEVRRKNEFRLRLWQEFKADRCAAALGTDMCDAGVEYYQQMLRLGRISWERNLDNGQLKYSADGDFLNSSTHPTLKQRLQRIDLIRRQLES